MNRKISICIFIFVILVIVLCVMANNGKQKQVPQTESQQSSEVEPTVIANSDYAKQFEYIARIVDERLVIFKSDGKTVYFETGIRADLLSNDIRKKAMRGIGFRSEESMYDFLESYSS